MNSSSSSSSSKKKNNPINFIFQLFGIEGKKKKKEKVSSELSNNKKNQEDFLLFHLINDPTQIHPNQPQIPIKDNEDKVEENEEDVIVEKEVIEEEKKKKKMDCKLVQIFINVWFAFFLNFHQTPTTPPDSDNDDPVDISSTSEMRNFNENDSKDLNWIWRSNEMNNLLCLELKSQLTFIQPLILSSTDFYHQESSSNSSNSSVSDWNEGFLNFRVSFIFMVISEI